MDSNNSYNVPVCKIAPLNEHDIFQMYTQNTEFTFPPNKNHIMSEKGTKNSLKVIICSNKTILKKNMKIRVQ